MKYIHSLLAKAIAVATGDSLSVEIVDTEISFDASKVLPIDVYRTVLLLVMAVENVILKSFLDASQSDGSVTVTLEINTPTHTCKWSHQIDYTAFCYKCPSAFLNTLDNRKDTMQDQLSDAIIALLEAQVNQTEKKAGDGYVIHRRY